MAAPFDLSTATAVLALIVSAITLWYSLLRPARISSVVGPEIRIYYPPDGGLGLYVPVTFLNQSPQAGTIWRCAVTLYAKTSGERFFMDWRYFFKLKPEGNGFDFDEVASAVVVPGNHSLSKLIWFSWRSFSNPHLLIAPVEYKLVFHYWTGATGRPLNDPHQFSIDETTFEALEEARKNKSARVFEVTLDKTLAANLVMSSLDAKEWLGIED